MQDRDDDRQSALRSLLGAVMPKEFSQYFQKELAVLRDEFLKALMVEVRGFLGRLDPAMEVQRVLDGLEFDVHLKVGVGRKKKEEQSAPPPETPVVKMPPAKRARAGKTRGARAG